MNGFSAQRAKQGLTQKFLHSFLHTFLWLGLAALALPASATKSAPGCDPCSGTLILKFGQGTTGWVAPTLDTDVDLSVTGPIARAVIRQRFHNPSDQWAEATYLFPLPETAAVDQLRMRIGERVIEGKIKERKEAKQIYQRAKKAGKRASLVEQERPNLFTTSVANIPPGEQIVVEIEYQHAVEREGQQYSLRYPMTVTPRYTPGQPIRDERGAAPQSGNGIRPDTDVVPDASRITPPWNVTAENTNPTRIRVELNPGFQLGTVVSPHHDVRMDAPTPSQSIVSLSERSHLSNSDFVLRWQPEGSAVPQAAFFIQQHQGDSYGLLQITPPTLEPSKVRLPRDVVFVIDTSGSMGGEPIRQAKKSLNWALDRLQPEDRFNIIEFNSTTQMMFDDVQPAVPGTLSRARTFVNQLQSRGGTEMLSAARAALHKDYDEAGRVRQVIFITDGAIGNEDQLFGTIQQNLGVTRLFTVGIGSAPNSYFMRKAAEFGRGTFTYIANASEVTEKMGELYRKIEAPVLTDLKLDLPAGSSAEILPNPIPDLYAGEPLVAVMKMSSAPDSISVSGRAGNADWNRTVGLDDSERQSGVHVLWARQKIEQLVDLRRQQRDPVGRDQLRRDVIDLALSHHLVSPFTSLVAVDVTPVRPADAPLNKQSVPNNAPKGTLFNPAQTATPALRNLLLALLLLIVAVMLWRGPQLLAAIRILVSRHRVQERMA